MKGRKLASKNYKSCTIIIGQSTRLLAVIETEEGQFRISALRPATHKDFDKGKLIPRANASLWMRGTIFTLTALSPEGKRALVMGMERLEELAMGEHDIIRLSEFQVGEHTVPLFTKEVEFGQPAGTQ